MDHPYEYGVHCYREGEGWLEGSSSNSGGWTSTDIESELGTISCWNRAPEGATRVRFRFLGETIEVPVENGYYLGIWWRVPCPDHDWPSLEAHLIDGHWR